MQRASFDAESCERVGDMLRSGVVKRVREGFSRDTFVGEASYGDDGMF